MVGLGLVAVSLIIFTYYTAWVVLLVCVVTPPSLISIHGSSSRPLTLFKQLCDWNCARCFTEIAHEIPRTAVRQDACAAPVVQMRKLRLGEKGRAGGPTLTCYTVKPAS